MLVENPEPLFCKPKNIVALFILDNQKGPPTMINLFT